MPRRIMSKITVTTTAALIFAVVLSSVVLAKDTPKERTQPRPAPAMPFGPSEELVYEGEFTKMLLRGINIAELRFKAQRPSAGVVVVEGEGQEAAPAPLVLTTDVTSKGFFPKVFGMSFKFHAESQVEPNDFYAMRTTKKDEQGKRVRTSEAVFDQQAGKVEYTERDPNNAGQAPRVITAALSGPTQDIVSAIYFLRTQALTPGQTFQIAVSDSGRIFQVPATVVAEKKKMKSVLGKVEVVRVDVELFGPGRPVEDGKGKMSIWVTSDERHVPVKARLSHDIGTLDITLKSIQREEALVAQR
jgi:DNA/RNA endonuclease YhcR with UshA esterase domain